MADETDPLTDPITQDLIGVLTGIIEMRSSDSPIEDETFLATVGTLITQLMPSDFTISGKMTSEELGQRISEELSGHMVRLFACFGYLFAELAEANDSPTDTSTAELLHEISLEIKQRNEEN
ncbi:hypothetical protein [Streptomyces sp. NPDC059970]|uniref:hypothetical protein n=1 Tax=Streptomyces sp. NPDC059970 TaxID=3347019 RepID=UPI003691FDF8